MEYIAMLSSPDLVTGLRDLLTDSDVAVVKRTVRVFANVYRHALRLLAEGELDEATFTTAWPAMKGVAEKIFSMLGTAENEGITVHVVRFLEAAIVAHLLSDVSRFPEIAARGPKMVAKGVTVLQDLISTPYIGGSAFLVAVRALITVACYKPDLWAPVTNLIERQIASPPPTLFDHNVRSLHKTLQRNLFRLLRRADTPALRSQLIEMMVTVGVPRRMLSQWAPPPEPRKRPAQPQSEDAITGRTTPPNKRARSDDDEEKAPPRDPRERNVPRDPRINGNVRDPRDPRDPRSAVRNEGRRTPPHDPRVTAPGYDTGAPRPRPTTPQDTERTTPEPQSKTPAIRRKEAVSNFEFLKSLITNKKKASTSFLDKCTDKERALYERLDHPSVVRLVLSCLDSVPDSPPEDLLGKLGRNPGDVAGIREQLTSLLAPHIHADFISNLTEEECSAPPSRPSSNSSAFSLRATPPHSEPSPPSPPSSARSTPSDPAQICHSDVDLRHILNRGFHPTGDIDMRDTKNLLPREPLVRENPRSNPHLDHPDHPSIPTSNRLDPRITMPDHTRFRDRDEGTLGGLDPRITQAYTDAHQDSISRGGPFLDNPRPPFMDAPQGYMGMSQGYMDGARPPFVDNIGGMRNNFDMGFDGGNPGPSMTRNIGPQDMGFMGPRGMMGSGPRGMGGPWQGVQHNRMGVMMPVMNGSGMFSPPMHL